MIRSNRRSILALLGVLLISALYLYANLFALAGEPFLLGGDQAYFWLRAIRMLDGQRVYRDFLQFTPPGTDLLFLFLFRLFGVRVWITNFVVLALGLAYVSLIFAIARRWMRRGSAALASVVFLVPIYGKALNATHHWFGVLAVLGAAGIVLRGGSRWRVAAGGAILGLASFFSLYHGLAGLLAFCVFLLWDGTQVRRAWAGLLREQALLFGGYVVALALLYSHYLMTGGRIGQLWYFQVTVVRAFEIDVYRSAQLMFPGGLTAQNLPVISEYLVVYLLLGFAIFGAVWICWRRRREHASIAPAVLLALVAVFLIAEVAVSPNWLRLYGVAAPAVILLGWVIDQLPRLRVPVVIAVWIWIVMLAAHQTTARHRIQSAVVDLPAGRVATTQQIADGFGLVTEFAKPGDDLFQAAWPGVYLPMHVRQSLSFDTAIEADMPRHSDVELAARELAERRVRYVLWAARLDRSCCDDRLTAMRNYVHAAYVLVATLPDGDTLWRRRE